MKKILLSLAILALGPAFIHAQAGPSAEDILKEACSIAGKENKKVFVMFTASWCGWCKRMDKSMADEDIHKYFDESFVVRHIVVDEFGNNKVLETPGGAAFRTKYGGDGQGIPFWLIFDDQGALIADSMRPDGDTGNKLNSGCPAEDTEVDYFIGVLKRTTSISGDHLDKIRKRFLKNKG